MQNNYRVNLGFAKYSDPVLDEFGSSVVTGLTANPAFPSPPLDPVTGLKPIATTFHDALQAAIGGGPALTAIKNAARVALLTALRQEAAYVQSMASLDLAMLLSSGFLANSTSRASTPLLTPGIAQIDNGNSGELILRLNGVNNAAAYEVQVKLGAGAWTPAGTYKKSRGIVLAGLTPGQTYTVQARGIGGSTGYSGWSDPMSHMTM